MLAKMISAMGMMVIFVVFLFLCVATVGLVGTWFKTQSTAQFIADSVGKYGGYTAVANQVLARLPSDGLRVTNVDVEPDAHRIPYGTPVEVTITAKYDLGVGWITLDAVEINGQGAAISRFWEGILNVQYTSPQY